MKHYNLTGLVRDFEGEVAHIGEGTSSESRAVYNLAYYANRENFAAWNLIATCADIETGEVQTVEYIFGRI